MYDGTSSCSMEPGEGYEIKCAPEAEPRSSFIQELFLVLAESGVRMRSRFASQRDKDLDDYG